MAAGSTGGRRGRAQGGRGTFRMNVTIEGVRGTLKAFRDLPKEASDALRDATLALSTRIAQDVATAGAAKGRQAAAVARTVRAKRDRVPNITIGGSSKVGRHGTPAFDLLFGSEFGAGGGKGSGARYAPFGYNPHAGKQGTWIFPTVERDQALISKAWNDVADDIVARFTLGGDE